MADKVKDGSVKAHSEIDLVEAKRDQKRKKTLKQAGKKTKSETAKKPKPEGKIVKDKAPNSSRVTKPKAKDSSKAVKNPKRAISTKNGVEAFKEPEQKHVRKGAAKFTDEFHLAKNEYYDMVNRNTQREEPFLKEIADLSQYFPVSEVIALIEEEVEASALDEESRSSLKASCTQMLLDNESMEQMSLFRHDKHQDIIDIPLNKDDSIIQEMEDHLADPLLEYSFEVPKQYKLELERPCKDKSIAGSKVVSQYKDKIVDVVSYTNVKTRVFPDGYRVAYHPNGDIQLFEPERNVFFQKASGTTTIKSKLDFSEVTVTKSKHYTKTHSCGLKFIRFPKGHAKVLRTTRDQLVKTVEGKYMKKSRFGKISFL